MPEFPEIRRESWGGPYIIGASSRPQKSGALSLVAPEIRPRGARIAPLPNSAPGCLIPRESRPIRTPWSEMSGIWRNLEIPDFPEILKFLSFVDFRRFLATGRESAGCLMESGPRGGRIAGGRDLGPAGSDFGGYLRDGVGFLGSGTGGEDFRSP